MHVSAVDGLLLSCLLPSVSYRAERQESEVIQLEFGTFLYL